MRALFDTNILIDHLRGIPAAATELARCDERAISAITWMEVLVGAPPGSERETRVFLDGFRLIEIDRAVAERAVALRRARRLKLPDAIVWASAQAHGMLLVTRDTKGFPPGDPGVRMPYSVRCRKDRARSHYANPTAGGFMNAKTARLPSCETGDAWGGGRSLY